MDDDELGSPGPFVEAITVGVVEVIVVPVLKMDMVVAQRMSHFFYPGSIDPGA